MCGQAHFWCLPVLASCFPVNSISAGIWSKKYIFSPTFFIYSRLDSIRSGVFPEPQGTPIYAPNVQWLIILDQIRSLEAFSFISSYYFLLSLIHQPSKSNEFKANERQVSLIHFQNCFSRFFKIIVIAIGWKNIQLSEIKSLCDFFCWWS